MVLKFHKEIEVSSYTELFQMYSNGEICSAYSQTIPEGKLFDFSDLSEHEKIEKLLKGDKFNVYVVTNVNGIFFIGMVIVNVSIEVIKDIEKGTRLYVQYGEDLRDTEIKHPNDDNYTPDPSEYSLDVY